MQISEESIFRHRTTVAQDCDPWEMGNKSQAEPYVFTSLLLEDCFQATEQEERTPTKIISIAYLRRQI